MNDDGVIGSAPDAASGQKGYHSTGPSAVGARVFQMYARDNGMYGSAMRNVDSETPRIEPKAKMSSPSLVWLSLSLTKVCIIDSAPRGSL
jgi:hypothetical protein